MEYEQDLKALQGFVDETNESLEDIEAAFVRLETDPSDLEIINKIFRPVHSMKGNSGFFGLTNINKFSHRMEDLLDMIRNHKVTIDRDVIDALLIGVEYLQKMLDRVMEDPYDVTLRPDEEDFLEQRIKKYKPDEVTGSAKSIIDLENLLEEAEKKGVNIHENHLILNVLNQVEKFNEDIRTLLKNHEESESFTAYSPERSYFFKGADYTEHVRNLGEVASVLAEKRTVTGDRMTTYAAALKIIRDAFEDNEEAQSAVTELADLSGFFDDELLTTNDEFVMNCRKATNDVISFFETRGGEEDENLKLGGILVEQKILSETELSEALGKQERVGEILVRDGVLKEEELQKALRIQDSRILEKHVNEQKETKQETKQETKTIRIDQSKLDSFADTVGELYINVDSFGFLKKQLEQTEVDTAIVARMTNTITSLDDKLVKLQNDVMSVRKVPLDNLFRRFPKVIRQLAGSLDKNINFKMTGEKTVVDKDLVEAIENPLVHILRNSADHGIETPEERVSKGKPEQGILELIASTDEYNVFFTIKDDGKGIDPQLMKKTALKKGFMSEAELETLNDQELVNLIFKPGFSTAEKISDVSGRGVGMDVVMSTLERTNGTVNVDSVLDKGSTVLVKIPLTRTLVTKDALIFRSDKQLFAVLSEDVTTTVYPENNIVNLLHDEGGISYNDSIIKLVDVNNYFFSMPKKKLKDKSFFVIIICEKYKIALIVDQIFSHQQIVVKVFGNDSIYLDNIPGVSGYTILGNEDIVLIADLEKMVNDM
ncbi:MAG: chemotaxis protein CheA [Thermodesulfobacteriota bacterium]|nr:chemotaxis protein CheA [Thermodesulfobacteriota bacterium]